MQKVKVRITAEFEIYPNEMQEVHEDEFGLEVRRVASVLMLDEVRNDDFEMNYEVVQ